MHTLPHCLGWLSSPLMPQMLGSRANSGSAAQQARPHNRSLPESQSASRPSTSLGRDGEDANMGDFEELMGMSPEVDFQPQRPSVPATQAPTATVGFGQPFGQAPALRSWNSTQGASKMINQG